MAIIGPKGKLIGQGDLQDDREKMSAAAKLINPPKKSPSPKKRQMASATLSKVMPSMQKAEQALEAQDAQKQSASDMLSAYMQRKDEQQQQLFAQLKQMNEYKPPQNTAQKMLFAASDMWAGTNLSPHLQRQEELAKQDLNKKKMLLEKQIEATKEDKDRAEMSQMKLFASREEAEADKQYREAVAEKDFKRAKELERLKASLRKSKLASGGGVQLTEGQKMVDKTFGKEYADYTLGGGFTKIETNLQTLNSVYKQLTAKDGKNLTGPILGKNPKGLRELTHPASVAAQEDVEGVIQQSLKMILGGQFSEKEADRLIQRAYNPSLDESDNAVRLKRVMDQLKTAAQAKQRASEYYENYGTMKGYKGTQNYRNILELDREGTSEDSKNMGPPSGMMRVRNPQTGETLDIPVEDFNDASAEGFQQVEM